MWKGRVRQVEKEVDDGAGLTGPDRIGRVPRVLALLPFELFEVADAVLSYRRHLEEPCVVELDSGDALPLVVLRVAAWKRGRVSGRRVARPTS